MDSLSLDAATENQVNVRVSSSGKLHVTFVGGYYLEYATNVSGSWVTTVFSTTPGVSAGVDGHALALDSQGNVHIAYCYRTTTGPSAPTHLGYMKYDASTHVWTDTTLDANNNAGVGPGISIGPDGEPVISYNSLYNLQLMRHSSSGWVSSVVIAGNGSDSTANCVGSTAICHDSGGRAHVAAYFVAHGQPVMLYVRGDGAYGWSDTVTTVPGVGAGGAARFDMVGTSAGFAQFLAMAYEPGGGSGIQYIEGLPGPSDTTPPATITDLHVITGDRSACAMWTAPGDDGAVGQATNYDVRFSYSPITSFSFPSEQQLPSPCPGLAGASECVSDTGLAACSPVYFAVKTRDESGNWSAMSNLASGTLRCHGRFPIDVSCSNGYRAAPTSQGDDGVPGLWITSANPTRSGVTLEFETAFPTRQVRLCVFDAAGRRIRSLETRSSGPTGGRAAWDLSKASGGRARAGIYFVRMEAPGCRFTRAVVVTD